MSVPLFWEDPYLIEFNAEIEKIDNKGIVLSRTAFYPMGGGQPADRGELIFNTTVLPVIDVQKEGKDIIHIIEGEIVPPLGVGKKIKGKIDWEYRYGLMKAHTCQHLVSAYIYNTFGSNTRDINLTPEEFSIHLDKPITANEMKIALKNCLELTTHHPRSITSHVLTQEEVHEKYIKKVRGDLSEEPLVRVLEIEGWDIMCCGGTHVAKTDEIGPLALTKFKGGVDIRLTFGVNATNLMAELNVDFLEISKILNSEKDKVVKILENRIQRQEEINGALDDVIKEYLDILSQTPGVMVDTTKLFIIPLGLDKKILNKHFHKFPEESLLISLSKDNRIQIYSSSQNESAKDVLDLFFENVGGKGGGNPKFAQGLIDNGLEDPKKEIIEILINRNYGLRQAL